MDIISGHRIISDDDPYVSHLDSFGRAMDSLGFGNTPVDVFPFRKHSFSSPDIYYVSTD